MTFWRHQVPVHSPLSGAAFLAGLKAAAVGNGTHRRVTAQLEELLRKRYAPKAVLLTDSGTTALTAALVGLQCRGKHRAVALPGYSCYDLGTAAEGAGARVFLYDVEPNTLAPDLRQLGVALNHGATAIVVTHLYGCPVDLTEINRLAAQAGAVVIEDAAQAAGATLNGQPLGTRGSLGVLSFGRGKGLTGGSGGALLAFDHVGVRALERARELLRREEARGWSELGLIAAQLVLERPAVYALPAALPFLHLGDTMYRAPRTLAGASTAACAVIAATWALADREAPKRRANAERLLRELREQGNFVPIDILPAAQPGYLRLPVLAAPAARSAITRARRLGVMPGYPRALWDVPRVRRRCLNRDGAFPGSRLLAERLCTLPTHSRLSPRDLVLLEQWIRESRVERSIPVHHST